MWFRKKRVYAFLFILVLLVLYFDHVWLGKLMYPIRYEQTIMRQSAAYEVDPYLVASIIRVESNFKTDKLSPKGAVGLMQLMPPTAEWIAKQEGDDENVLKRLQEPDVNIKYGVWYIRSLKEQFVATGESASARGELTKADEIALIAAAYNAGPGNVGRWLSEGVWSGRFSDADDIPFGETRHYVHRVVYYYHKYLQTYSDWG